MSLKNLFVKIMIKKWAKQEKESFSGKEFPENIKEVIDIPYINDGQKGHLLDVYYPENTLEKLPVILDIHAGGLIYGYKEMNKLYGYHLAKRGFIVFNINYRLALNDTKVFGQIQDILSAMKWISKNQNKYPVDKGKIFITGESGGGYLAAMGTLVSKSTRLQKIFDTENPNIKIKAVGIVCGMMNLETPTLAYWGHRSMCFGKGYKNKEYYQNMIFDKIPEMKNFPPTFLTSSEEDKLSFMTQNFEKVLQKNNVDYKMKYYEKKNDVSFEHIFSIFDPERRESVELIDEMLNFFKSKAS